MAQSLHTQTWHSRTFFPRSCGSEEGGCTMLAKETTILLYAAAGLVWLLVFLYML
jgi:hypothetical protein